MSELTPPTKPDPRDLIPITAHCVLALGDGADRLRSGWQERCPTARWIAVTPEDAVDEEALSERLAGIRPDCLLLDWGSERTEDTAAMLERLIDRLADDALIIAVVPNPGHWSRIAELLKDDGKGSGPPPAQDRKRIRRLLTDAGLAPLKELPLTDEGESQTREQVLSACLKLAKSLGEKPEDLRRRLTTAGHVLLATKGERPKTLHVQQLVMVPDFMTVRTDQPLAALNSLPFVKAVSHKHGLTLPKLPEDEQKILLVQRQIVLDAEDWLRHVRRLSSQGWVLIAEWDDHPELLPADTQVRWRKHPWLPMRSVHAMQTSTEPLAEVFRAYNPNIAVFENALASLPPLPRKSERHLRLIFAAFNREDVNPWLAPILNRVMNDYPQTQIAIVHNRELYEQLEVEEDRKSFRQSLSYAGYMKAVGGAHIALLPLAGSEPERYKSDVKFIECASRGTVCIASPLLYEERMLDGERGLIARSPEEWLAALRRVIEDKSLRETIAAKAYDYCRAERMLSTQTEARLAWYRDLCRRQADLHSELMARLDAL